MLEKELENIKPMDESLREAIQNHLDDLTKPQGSLGRLEETALRLCMIQNTQKPMAKEKMIVTFAGDHGVSEEGVSAFPAEVTAQMVANMIHGGAAVNVFSRHAGAKSVIVNVGVRTPVPGINGDVEKDGVQYFERIVAPGTKNFAKEYAMSEEETLKAMQVGMEMGDYARSNGVKIAGTGEMGIANTTPASALFAALLPVEAEKITGRGTGIDDNALKNKISVIQRSLELHKDKLKDPFQALACVGGLEIAAIAGFILRCSAHRIAVVVDGFISSSAALVAMRMKPEVKEYLFFSHMSAEAGHREFFAKEGFQPILDLQMRLGEGSAAALAMFLLEASVKMYNEMATFSGAGVSNKEH